jgi:hypothetical protein
MSLTSHPTASVGDSEHSHATASATSAPRSELRRYAAGIVITVAVAQALGLTLKMPTQLEANDISRWCTVWSLLERGTYAIDECPWQFKTQDKVKKRDKLTPPAADDGWLRRLEYRLAPSSWKEGEAKLHFYSSKPQLLPTMIAGILYPFHRALHVPLGHTVDQSRIERNVQKEDPQNPGHFIAVTEKPKEPVKWPAYVLYLKPTIVALNVIPFWFFLVFFARLLDRYAENDWAWLVSLVAAAWATPLLVFDQTLNNHTVAAFSAFFALYAFLRLWNDDEKKSIYFLMAGFFGAFCACNELPAASFGLLLFLLVMIRSFKKTLLYFLPAAAIPCIAFLVTQFLAFGQFRPVYEEFGTQAYEYEGSYWNTPLEMDWFNKHPEPMGVYLFHMTFGHHGIFSLTPIFLVSVFGALRALIRRSGLRAVSAITLLLTAGMLGFYTWNPIARNYGGSTQGLRWLFWLIPFWLIVLPQGLAPCASKRWSRVLTLFLLAVSAFSVGYSLRVPWSHPWIVDMMEHLNLMTLQR